MRKREINCSECEHSPASPDQQPRVHRMILRDSAGEFYLFFFPASKWREVLRVAGQFAENQDLAFSGAEREFVAEVMERQFDGN